MSREEAGKLADEADEYAREGKTKPAKRKAKSWIVGLIQKALA